MDGLTIKQTEVTILVCLGRNSTKYINILVDLAEEPPKCKFLLKKDSQVLGEYELENFSDAYQKYDTVLPLRDLPPLSNLATYQPKKTLLQNNEKRIRFGVKFIDMNSLPKLKFFVYAKGSEVLFDNSQEAMKYYQVQ